MVELFQLRLSGGGRRSLSQSLSQSLTQTSGNSKNDHVTMSDVVQMCDKSCSLGVGVGVD